MTGYPPGTQCVITRTLQTQVTLGQIVTCLDEVFRWQTGGLAYGGLMIDFQQCNGLVVQHVVGPHSDSGRVHPIDWMRPLDKDTDAVDREVAEAYKPVTVAKRGVPIDLGEPSEQYP